MDNLIEVSNYPVRYPEAWNNGVGFVENGEAEWPLYTPSPVPVLSLYGEIDPACTSCVVTGESADPRLLEEAGHLALELAHNRQSISLAGSVGRVRKRFREVYLKHGGKLEMHVNCGLNALRKDARLRRLSTAVLANEGCIISPFDPDMESDRGKDARLLSDTLALSKPSILVLALPSGFLPLLESALDSGSEIYIHTSALVSKAARNLVEDGASLVESGRDYLRQTGRDVSTLVYRDPHGRTEVDGCFYSLLDLSR